MVEVAQRRPTTRNGCEEWRTPHVANTSKGISIAGVAGQRGEVRDQDEYMCSL